jgi:hypothetical protein
MPSVKQILDFSIPLARDYIIPSMSVAADALSLLVGLFALWAFVFRRKEIAKLLATFSNAFAAQRLSRIKETLGKLESLNWDQKENRSEITALAGQICGQLRPLLEEFPKLEDAHKQWTVFAQVWRHRSESRKRQLIYELHGILDMDSFDQHTQILRKYSDER